LSEIHPNYFEQMTSSTLTNIRLAPNVYISPVTEDGCIILDFGRDKVLSINKTGALILHKIAASESGLSRAELISAAGVEINASVPSRIESIVDDLINKLNEKGLLQFSAISASTDVQWLWGMMAQRSVNGARFLIEILLKLKLHIPAALAALLMVDAVLKLIGINALRRIVSDWPISGGAPDSEMIAYICTRLVRACTWYSKNAPCLQRSAAATCLLRSIGAPAEMVIGVHKMPFYGHAWVEVHGEVVNDHPKVQTFFQALSRC
jgi:Transglutaminase-like superfamily